MSAAPSAKVNRLERKVERLRKAVGTLIAWMSQSAVSPISRTDAQDLLNMMEDNDEM
jgi:hypothetical protein